MIVSYVAACIATQSATLSLTMSLRSTLASCTQAPERHSDFAGRQQQRQHSGFILAYISYRYITPGLVNIPSTMAVIKQLSLDNVTEHINWTSIWIAIGLLFAAYFGRLWYNIYLYPRYFSPLRVLPGPKPTSLLFGNFLEIRDGMNGSVQLEWVKKYGQTVRYIGFFGSDRIISTDPRILQHIMTTKVYDYPKPTAFLGDIVKVLGNGLVFAEGNDHKRQRKLLNPAFALSNIKSMVPSFYSPSKQMVTALKEEIASQGGNKAHVELTPLLSKTTLQIIGLAGFGVDFKCFDENPTSLVHAYDQLFNAPNQALLLRFFRNRYPILRFIRIPFLKTLEDTSGTVKTVSQQLLRDRQIALAEGRSAPALQPGVSDLLTIMVEHQMAGGDEKEAPWTDEEIRAQIMTFLAAGHETTSTSSTWSLYEFARHPEMQERARKEIFDRFPDSEYEPTYDELTSELPYLTAFTKEVLRLLAPVPSTNRVASKDDVLPPPYNLRMPKGTHFFIMPSVVHRDTRIFGPDAEVFNPDRYLHPLPETVTNFAFLTFLAGNRSCIGNKFAVAELKAILYVLLRHFRFSESEPGAKVDTETRITLRPKEKLKMCVELL